MNNLPVKLKKGDWDRIYQKAAIAQLPSSKEGKAEYPGFKTKFIEYATEKFHLAISCINFQFHGNMIKYLSSPSKFLLNILSDHNAQQGGVSFAYLVEKIKEKMLKSSLARGSSSNFTFKLFKDCLIKLEMMGMVHISRKPIGDESVMILLIANDTIQSMKTFD
jgi:hypothetical protein